MVALTQTQTPVDYDAMTVCDYCLQPAVARNMVHLVVRGVMLDICHIDAAYIGRHNVHTRARMLLRLARLYGGAQAEDGGDGDGDDPDGGPAPAAPAARPVALALVAAGAGTTGLELSPEEEARLDAFEQAVAESRDPEPCARCGKVASPGVETDAGTFCLTCGEAEPSALPAIRQWRLWRTCARIQAARITRELAALR